MSADSPRVYLLDVEGTTSPVSLVSEQLFPYARKHLAGYLREHGNEPETQADLACWRKNIAPKKTRSRSFASLRMTSHWDGMTSRWGMIRLSI